MNEKDIAFRKMMLSLNAICDLEQKDNSISEELIRLRAENDVLRELAGLRKKSGTVAV